MKKGLIIGLLILTLIAGPLFAIACEEEEEELEPIKIGAIYPITGIFAEAYPRHKAGADYVVDQINAAGGIMGRQVVLVEKDSACTPEQALLAAQSLYDNEGIRLFLGDTISGCNAALVPWAEENEVVLVSCAGTKPVLSVDAYWTFSCGANRWGDSRVVAQECVNIGAKKIFNVILEGQTETFEMFWDHMNELDPTVENVGETWVGFADVDFSPHITAALASGADTVAILLYGQFFTGFLLQAEGFGFFDQVSLMSIGHFDAEYTDPMATDVPDGINAVINMPWWLDTPEMEAFTDYHLEQTDGMHPGCSSTIGLTTTAMLLGGIEEAQSTDKEAVREALEGLTVDTVLGSLTMDAEFHLAPTPVWWCEIGFVPEHPGIAVATSMEKHQEDTFPFRELLREWRAEE